MVLALAACDGKTYYDDDDIALPIGEGVRIVVYQPPEPVYDFSRYSILDLAETVSEPMPRLETMPVVEAATEASEQVEPDHLTGLQRLFSPQGKRPTEDDQQPKSDEQRRADGYHFAQRLGIVGVKYCRGDSAAFVDGCLDYMLEMQSVLEYPNR